MNNTKTVIMTDKINQIIQFGLDNDLEIVSYGLAPNPNGFCFESHGDASPKVQQRFRKMLESLTSDETLILKEYVF